MSDRSCVNCGRVWMTCTDSPCDCPPEEGDGIRCIDRAILGHHVNRELDVDEVASRSCLHGTEYNQLCKGCGHKVSGWGIGAAGFLELCGCTPTINIESERPFGQCGCGSTSCAMLTADHQCWCSRCNPNAWWMVTCGNCGNKRCPRAADHRHKCTQSNLRGQPGSNYP